MGAAVYGNSYFYQEPLLYRVIGVIVVSGLGLFILTTTLEGKEALKTVIDSRTEIRRVVWPTRTCLLYTSPSPRDRLKSRMPSSA